MIAALVIGHRLRVHVQGTDRGGGQGAGQRAGSGIEWGAVLKILSEVKNEGQSQSNRSNGSIRQPSDVFLDEVNVQHANVVTQGNTIQPRITGGT